MKIKTKKIKIGKLINQSLELPLIEIGDDGPVIGIVGGVHGNEPESLFIMRELVMRLRKMDLKKRVRLLPGANPMALINNNRVGAFDYKDLNRSFPGNSKGVLSDRIAAAIFNTFSDCELVMDIHSVTNIGIFMGMELNCKNKNLMEKTRQVNRLLNPLAIWRAVEGDKYSTAMDEAFLRKGILGIGVEVPRLELIDDGLMKRIVDGIVAVITRFGEPKKLGAGIPLLDGAMRHFADDGGIYTPVMKVMSPVKKGDVIGILTDLTTMKDKKLRSEFEGVLFVQSSRKVIRTGDKVYVVIKKIGEFK